MSLPLTQQALVLSSFSDGPELKTIETPSPTTGSAVLNVLSTNVLTYARSLYNGTLQYPLTLPMVIGSSAIGRIAAIGPDATRLKPGQLVLFEIFIHGRDAPQDTMLFGTMAGFTPQSRRLMEGEWRHATYAEFAKVPLENCYALDEEKLTQTLGYSMDELAYMLRQVVPMGGLFELDIKPGETIIVAPASGAFGGAAVEVAIAMGATVVAAGRNVNALQKLAKFGDRVKIVRLKGEVDADAKALSVYGEVDAYLDFSPAAAAKSTHILSCLMALKTKGRACLMGGIQENVSIPYALLMSKSLQLKGRFMYEREAILRLIKMVEGGVLQLGARAGIRIAGTYSLADWEKAFSAAEENTGWGVQVLLAPQKK